MKIPTPQKDYSCDCELAEYSYLDFKVDGSSTQVEVTTGKFSGKENMYEPPSLVFDFDSLLSVVDGIKHNDVKKVYSSMVTVCSEPLHYKWNDRPRTPIQKSEAQVEYCIQNSIDLLAYGRKLEFVNPSRGTVHRVAKHYKDAVVRFTPDVDKSYKVSVARMLNEVGVRLELGPWEVDPEVLYYVSFNGSIAEKMGMQHYIGFELNPSSLVHSGYCMSQKVSRAGMELQYNRSGVLKTFTYGRKTKNVVPIDTLHRLFARNSKFRIHMGLMHDMYTTLPIGRGTSRISNKVQLTYGTVFLVGNYTDNGSQIFNSRGRVVYSTSHYAHSSRTIRGPWRQPDAEGKVMASASYMISRYSSTVTRLGHKLFAKPVEVNGDMIIGGKYYNLSPRYSDDCISLNVSRQVIPLRHFPYKLDQGIGHLYCTSSYENVVSTSVKYVEDFVDIT